MRRASRFAPGGRKEQSSRGTGLLLARYIRRALEEADLASPDQQQSYSVALTPSFAVSILFASTEAAEITGLNTGPKGGA